MKGIAQWVWIVGSIIAAIIIFTMAYNQVLLSNRAIVEQESIKQFSEVVGDANNLCWEIVGNKRELRVNLGDMVEGIYAAESAHTEYEKEQLINKIILSNNSIGKYLCLKITDKRLECEEVGCNVSFPFIGYVPEKFSLSALVDSLKGKNKIYTYSLVLRRDPDSINVFLKGLEPTTTTTTIPTTTIPPACPDPKMKCSGAPMDGGPGDSAWIDSNGDKCCPSNNIDDTSGPVCSNRHCCPTHLPKWCSKPASGQPRCMSEVDYKDKTICKPIQVFVVAFIPVSYSDLNEFKARASFMKDFTEKNLPFRENPESLVILIGDKNCPATEDDIYTLKGCGNDLAQANGYPGAQLTGGIFGVCVGGDGCGGILGYTDPGQGWFVAGYDTCTIFGCPSNEDSVVAPHEIGHNFRLCEGYGWSGYSSERASFGYCGTSRIEQKFPYQRSATSNRPCDSCSGQVCCNGRILDNDPINPINGGRDIMGPGQQNPDRAFACDSYLAFKDVAVSVFKFDLPPVTDSDIQKCYDHIKGDIYP